MEHCIYSGDGRIIICPPSGIPSSCHDIFHVSRTEEAVSLAGMFKDGHIRGTVYATSGDTERTYSMICSEYKEVNAAGGLVSDGEGRFLAIRRNGLWDLPKGHQEAGEEISTTALREVSEETGITGLKLGDLLGITDHCYLRDGIWHLKHTWWFRMESCDMQGLEPQTEEGITEAVWKKAECLEEVMKDTYPSIADVFRMAGLAD